MLRPPGRRFVATSRRTGRTPVPARWPGAGPADDPPDALARPAVGGARGQPRLCRPAAADLPRDHRRVRRHGFGRGDPRRGGRLRVGDGPAQLRGADPARLPPPAAGPGRPRVRWRVRGHGPGDELRDLRDPERPVADRRLAAAPGRERPARRAIPAGAARVRDQRPHRRREPRHGRHRRSSGRRCWPRSAGAACRSCSAWLAVLIGARHPGPRPRTRHGPGRGRGRRQQPRRAAPGPGGPRPALAVPHLGARWRRARPWRREPVRAAST